MPYIGNQAGNRFVASKAASVYSGDGSTTAFTLEHAVGSDEDILVSVDGVIQEPSVAYAVSSGTTLTFTAAPSTNSGNNIFVYYLFRTVGTVDHPATSALSATSGTFTTDLTVDTSTLKVDSTNNRVGIGTTSPDYTFEIETAANAIANFKSTDANANIRFTDSNSTANGYAGIGAIGNDLTLIAGNDNRMKIDSTGAVTMPNQPAFMARPASAQTGISSGTTLVFGTEIFDQNADFASNTFTAPTTGRYHISYTLYFEDVRNDITAFYVTTVLSNRDIYTILDPQAYDQTVTNLSLNFSLLADMDANDTVFLKYYQTGGGDNTNMNVHSYFTGYLVA